MTLFVVISRQGPGWAPGQGLREQPGWDEHARFMDALEAEKVVVLGGPLGNSPGVHQAMLVVNVPDEETLRHRLAADPWMRTGVLRIAQVHPWELLLGKVA